jgi:hypothetical protein
MEDTYALHFYAQKLGHEKVSIMEQPLLAVDQKPTTSFALPHHKLSIKNHNYDEISVVLSQNKNVISTLAKLTIPKVSQIEDNNKLTTLKRSKHQGFELVVEYRRDRISSRNSDDMEWELVYALLHVREPPSILSALCSYLSASFLQAQLQDEKTCLTSAIDLQKREETRLSLALMDVRNEIATKRKRMTSIEKDMITQADRVIVAKDDFEKLKP